MRETGSGFVVDEPIEFTLIELLRDLIARREEIQSRRDTLLNLPEQVLVEPEGFMADLLDQVLEPRGTSASAPLALSQPDQA